MVFESGQTSSNRNYVGKNSGDFQFRLFALLIALILAFCLIGLQMVLMATKPNNEEIKTRAPNNNIGNRKDVVDRQGKLLATNISVNSLYAHPHEIIDKVKVITDLDKIFVNEKAGLFRQKIMSDKPFVWLKKTMSPDQQESVMDIGQPGLYFGPRKMRIFPNGEVASHALGGVRFGEERVDGAEILGTAGIELYFDDFLREFNKGDERLELSLDLTLQSLIEQILQDGIRLMEAKGGSVVLMNSKTGEILSLVSFPEFDPNDRPKNLFKDNPADSPIFNRAVQGIYELGSVFKIFTVALALDKNLVEVDTKLNTKGPLRIGGRTISDHKYFGPSLTVEEIIVKSSNVGTVRIANKIGSELLKDFYANLGLLDRTSLELPETRLTVPQSPRKWKSLDMATASYGHGIAVSPIHLAAAYSSLVNGGYKVNPTLLLKDKKITDKVEHEQKNQVIRNATSSIVRSLLNRVVVDGTAKDSNFGGYNVGGKTGTAEKPNPVGGGYYEDKVISTFASVFPISTGDYVLVVTLDEPENNLGSESFRYASKTAVPISAKIISRIGPLLGLKLEKK
ncbi:MAG: cell division protein FtsI [Rhodobacteraceae bacterium]|nr:cell division protein FtsI [Paracoccaceae bacterium]